MEQYIDKSAVVAEIEKRRDAALTRQHNLEAIGQETVLNKMIANELNRIISILDTLEVKGVDLEEDINDFINEEYHYTEYDGKWVDEKDWRDSIQRCARHFFELGIAVGNKVQKGE